MQINQCYKGAQTDLSYNLVDPNQIMTDGRAFSTIIECPTPTKVSGAKPEQGVKLVTLAPSGQIATLCANG
jgi:hypothetical protein